MALDVDGRGAGAGRGVYRAHLRGARAARGGLLKRAFFGRGARHRGGDLGIGALGDAEQAGQKARGQCGFEALQALGAVVAGELQRQRAEGAG